MVRDLDAKRIAMSAVAELRDPNLNPADRHALADDLERLAGLGDADRDAPPLMTGEA
ncbi:MAG: hypothetical protein U1C74_27325 [Phenylobacterium sp.]|nr:hypothetical protein [Phenylobacterium sp.]